MLFIPSDVNRRWGQRDNNWGPFHPSSSSDKRKLGAGDSLSHRAILALPSKRWESNHFSPLPDSTHLNLLPNQMQLPPTRSFFLPLILPTMASLLLVPPAWPVHSSLTGPVALKQATHCASEPWHLPSLCLHCSLPSLPAQCGVTVTHLQHPLHSNIPYLLFSASNALYTYVVFGSLSHSVILEVQRGQRFFISATYPQCL